MIPIVPISLPTIVQVIGAAGFYTLAMVLMKFWPNAAGVLAALAIAAAFAAGAAMEIEALRDMKLGMVYVLILGVETLMVIVASSVIFGESFGLREWLGGALVLAGVMLVAV